MSYTPNIDGEDEEDWDAVSANAWRSLSEDRRGEGQICSRRLRFGMCIWMAAHPVDPLTRPVKP